MGHGHVVPNPDGSKARCGGPRICSVCSREQAALQPLVIGAGGVTNCARCGGAHERVAWKRFERPVEIEGAARIDLWAACPSNGDPILGIIESEDA